MNRKFGVQIISFLTILSFIFIVFPLPVQSSPQVPQKTIIVDINGKGDYSRIKDAIGNSSSTDIVFIRKGIYYEHSITVNKKIELIGEDSASTIINCSGHPGFKFSSSYVEISNLKITNMREYAISVPPGSNGCSISNCTFRELNKGNGIDIRSSYNDVSTCIIEGFDRSGQGIKIHGSYNKVINCLIKRFSNGIMVLLESNKNIIMDSNIFDNENAVDIRLGSNDNLVSNCNLYSNLQGIKIWQNSNNNLVYHNNFWKNDIAVVAEGNNIWDNNKEGNFWDNYLVLDANRDGIGDMPYVISDGNQDNFPLMTMVLPNVISVPMNIQLTSTNWDNSPSFGWEPALYREGIKGYYVRVDSNPEIFIGAVARWTSSDTITDGVHTFYIKARGNDNATSVYASLTFFIDSNVIDIDNDGWLDEEEQRYGTDPADKDNYPLDTDNDHIPDFNDEDDDNDGYPDNMELSYNSNPIDAEIYPDDTDHDLIPDKNSAEGKYIGDTDDDDDGISDIQEKHLGSNPKNRLDAYRIYFSGQQFYFIDVTQNSYYDLFFDPLSNATTWIGRYDQNYLIDKDGDGRWDYIYDTKDHLISSYKEESALPFGIIVLSMIVALVTILIIGVVLSNRIKSRFRFLQKPELEKITLPLPIRESKKYYDIDKKDVREMVYETIEVLQNIQKDITTHLEKLIQIDKHFEIVSGEMKKEKTLLQPKSGEQLQRNLEDEIDELIGKFEEKQK